jgi:hypothetical protein
VPYACFLVPGHDNAHELVGSFGQRIEQAERFGCRDTMRDQAVGEQAPLRDEIHGQRQVLAFGPSVVRVRGAGGERAVGTDNGDTPAVNVGDCVVRVGSDDGVAS